jgi:hypothetical protein
MRRYRVSTPLRLQNLEPKEERRHSVGEIDYAATGGARQTGKNEPPEPRRSCWGLL